MFGSAQEGESRMDQPTVKGKVSVIMGVYNCATTIESAIQSILTQTYENWELIVCDDGSEDDTYRIAEKLKNQYPEKITLLRNEKNLKLAATLNRCLQYATGEYIARMDGDDVSLPERLEKQVAFLKSHPDIVLVGTAVTGRYHGHDRIIRIEQSPNSESMITGVPFFHPTIMVYRSTLKLLGDYTVAERTNRCEDVDLWFRFFKAKQCGANLEEPLYIYTVPDHKETVKDYIGKWKTEMIGYRMLKYPVHVYITTSVKMLIRVCVPNAVLQLYRKTRYAGQPETMDENNLS